MTPITEAIRGVLEPTPVQRRAFALRRAQIVEDGLDEFSDGAITSIQDGLVYQARERLKLFETLGVVLEERRRVSDDV